MKKESLANKPPEKPISEVSNGSPLLLSETIIRTNKKGTVHESINSLVKFICVLRTFKRMIDNPTLFSILKV